MLCGALKMAYMVDPRASKALMPQLRVQAVIKPDYRVVKLLIRNVLCCHEYLGGKS